MNGKDLFVRALDVHQEFCIFRSSLGQEVLKQNFPLLSKDLYFCLNEILDEWKNLEVVFQTRGELKLESSLYSKLLESMFFSFFKLSGLDKSLLMNDKTDQSVLSSLFKVFLIDFREVENFLRAENHRPLLDPNYFTVEYSKHISSLLQSGLSDLWAKLLKRQLVSQLNLNELKLLEIDTDRHKSDLILAVHAYKEFLNIVNPTLFKYWSFEIELVDLDSSQAYFKIRPEIEDSHSDFAKALKSLGKDQKVIEKILSPTIVENLLSDLIERISSQYVQYSSESFISKLLTQRKAIAEPLELT